MQFLYRPVAENSTPGKSDARARRKIPGDALAQRFPLDRQALRAGGGRDGNSCPTPETPQRPTAARKPPRRWSTASAFLPGSETVPAEPILKSFILVSRAGLVTGSGISTRQLIDFSMDHKA